MTHDEQNYDGQGKTSAQETQDSLTMLTIVCMWGLIVLLLIGYWLWPASAQAEWYITGDRTEVCGIGNDPASLSA